MKKKIALLFMVIAITIMITPVQAKAENRTYEVEIAGVKYVLNNHGYNNGYLIETSMGYYMYVLTNAEVKLSQWKPYKKCTITTVNTNDKLKYYANTLDNIINADITEFTEDDDTNNYTIDFEGDFTYTSTDTLYYFGNMIADKVDGNATWTFRNSSPLKRGYQLQPLYQATMESKTVMMEILGLVPLVIGFLVLVIGFYKALTLLKQLFLRA